MCSSYHGSSVCYVLLDSSPFEEMNFNLDSSLKKMEETDYKPETNIISNGKSLVESYQSRVITLCVLYIAQGLPWAFITVTFVTFLAVEGVSWGEASVGGNTALDVQVLVGAGD